MHDVLFNLSFDAANIILTVVTVLALPINLVAGLLGMNVGGIPFQQHPQGFMLVMGTLTAITGILAYILFRRRRD